MIHDSNILMGRTRGPVPTCACGAHCFWDVLPDTWSNKCEKCTHAARMRGAPEPEAPASFAAFRSVCQALEPLEASAQRRVLRAVAILFGLET